MPARACRVDENWRSSPAGLKHWIQVCVIARVRVKRDTSGRDAGRTLHAVFCVMRTGSQTWCYVSGCRVFGIGGLFPGPGTRMFGGSRGAARPKAVMPPCPATLQAKEQSTNRGNEAYVAHIWRGYVRLARALDAPAPCPWGPFARDHTTQTSSSFHTYHWLRCVANLPMLRLRPTRAPGRWRATRYRNAGTFRQLTTTPWFTWY